MSASSKPPRRGHNAKPPTTERVARVLLDAQVLGDRTAGVKHGLHYNTIGTWRREWGDAPLVVAEMDKLRAAVREGWIDEARDARRAIIDRMKQLAGTSKSLRAVTEAGRRINEMVVAHEVLHDDPDSAAEALDAEHHGADQREAAGEVEGPGADEGGEGPGDLGGGEG